MKIKLNAAYNNNPIFHKDNFLLFSSDHAGLLELKSYLHLDGRTTRTWTGIHSHADSHMERTVVHCIAYEKQKQKQNK